MRFDLGFAHHCFKVASEKLCCDKCVTIHLVVPLRYRLLLTVCKEEERDSDVIRAFKVNQWSAGFGV